MSKLPTELKLGRDFVMSEELAEMLAEEINDYLSDKYGYCVEGYGWDIELGGITWDTSEEEAYEQDREWDEMRHGR